MPRTRALVTESEWEQITSDIDDSRRDEAIAQVRKRITEELTREMAMFAEHHPNLLEEVLRTVCDDERTTNCPDCGGRVVHYKRYLAEDELTTVRSCLNCEFKIETESNLAKADREKRMRKRTDTES